MVRNKTIKKMDNELLHFQQGKLMVAQHIIDELRVIYSDNDLISRHIIDAYYAINRAYCEMDAQKKKPSKKVTKKKA